MVTPVESFQGSSVLWIAQTKNRDNQETCWVRIFNKKIEDFVIHRNFRVGVLETIEFEHLSFSVQTETTGNAEKKKLTPEKHVRVLGQLLSLPELSEVKNSCQKFEKSCSKSASDLSFINQIEHQIKLKADAKLFGRVLVSMGFDVRKALKKFEEGLTEADIITPSHSNWAAPSIQVPSCTGPHTGWDIQFSCRPPWTLQANRKRMLAVGQELLI